MKEYHIGKDLLIDYILGYLSEEEAKEIARHLESCEECRKELFSEDILRIVFEAHGAEYIAKLKPTEDCPKEEELREYVERRIKDKERIEALRTHILGCSYCMHRAVKFYKEWEAYRETLIEKARGVFPEVARQLKGYAELFVSFGRETVESIALSGGEIDAVKTVYGGEKGKGEVGREYHVNEFRFRFNTSKKPQNMFLFEVEIFDSKIGVENFYIYMETPSRDIGSGKTNKEGKWKFPDKIPYGKYIVTISPPGQKEIEVRIRVDLLSAISGEKNVKGLIKLADECYAKENIVDAIRILERAHDIDPENIDVIIKLCNLYGSSSLYDKILKLIKKMEKGGKDPRIMMHKAMALQRKKQYEETIPIFQEIINSSKPNDVDKEDWLKLQSGAHLNYVFTYIAADEIEKAVEIYVTAWKKGFRDSIMDALLVKEFKVRGDEGTAHFMLMQILKSLGEGEELKDFAKSLHVVGLDELLGYVDARMKEIRVK